METYDITITLDTELSPGELVDLMDNTLDDLPVDLVEITQKMLTYRTKLDRLDS